MSELIYEINLLGDYSVVTKDGEYLGTWGTDESDAIYEFTPDGEDQYLLEAPFRWQLCEKIIDWHSARSYAGERKAPVVAGASNGSAYLLFLRRQ